MTKTQLPKTLFTAAPLAIETEADVVVLRGYAAIWNSLSADRGGFKVRLLPNSVRLSVPTLAMYNHKSDYILGSTASGTLKLKSDHYGLKCEIVLPATSIGKDVGELVRRQDISGMSFAIVQYDSTEDVVEKGVNVMEVKRCLIDEVTVCAQPAFASTSISVRRSHDAPFSNTPEARRRRAWLAAEQLRLQLYDPDLVLRR